MSRLALLGVILGVGALGACGGSDAVVPPPPEPTMAIVGGDHQSANVRHPLSDPLAIAVTTPNGLGVIGVNVEWTVTAGGGTLTQSYPTDAQGRASVIWTLGNTPGAQSVTATMTGGAGSPTSFSATATAPIVLHYDGTSWSTALEDVNGALISFTSIWGATGSAVFAVGKSCAGPLALPYDGNHWGQLPASCPGADPNQLTSVWGSSPVDLFATHRIGIPPHLGGSVDHYDGQNWNYVYIPPCGGTGMLCPSPQAVWSSSPSDVLAVGDAGMIVHYDGTSWTPLQSGTTQPLAGIWGAGAGSAVFAVGAGGTILNYDGTTWRAQTSGTTQSLHGVWGTSANDVFAVGSGGTILHYDGTGWTAQVSGSTQALYSVWGNSGNSVFAVGDASTILHYDGTRWTAQTTAADMNLRGVWGSSTTSVFAVGVPR